MAAVRGSTYPVGTHLSGPVKLGVKSALLSTDLGGISAARTLTADESNGQNYILDGGTGFAITLPPVAELQGWCTKFTIGAAFATDFVITSQAADLQGSIVAGGIVILVGGGTTLTIQDNLEEIGDCIELWSDGTSIFVKGNQATTLATAVA